MKRKKTTTDAVEILHRRFVDNDPEMQEALNEVRADHRIAKAIMELRGKLGLSQKKFADLVGTNALVIRRLEDADYEGNSMSMLEHIAAAVKHELELDIRFVVAKKSQRLAKNGTAKMKNERAVG